MSIKVEPRGKYAGVKVHLDKEECDALIEGAKLGNHADTFPIKLTSLAVPLRLAIKMGQSIKEALADNPDLLKERTPEQIAAILAKESEKAGLQLNALKNGANWKKIDPTKLQAALLHHVK